MVIEELFAAARNEIFGMAPSDKLARVGYNMAVTYYDPLIEGAERALLGIGMPEMVLPSALVHAREFTEYHTLDYFERPTLNALIACSERFQKRYEPLYEQYGLKAA